MGRVTENMKIFLVTVLLSLTILGQARGAPGQHLLIETEDGGDSSEGGDERPAVGAGMMMGHHGRQTCWPWGIKGAIGGSFHPVIGEKKANKKLANGTMQGKDLVMAYSTRYFALFCYDNL